ncbi:MAG: alpha/beta hydrolase [Anaerolineales bacterium]|nr:alpha/beta hydrolase [Anaerolineales bacterium]MCB8959890.1 alpha/beta hydrolase [Ardenticatenales bacterium]
MIWRNMDQKTLDDAYNQRVYAPNFQQILGRYEQNSERARQRLGQPQRRHYGPAPIEGLDLFLCDQPAAPIQIFIHGGAWRSGSARSYAFPAEMFRAAGAHWLVPDFSWVQDVGDSLLPIADQVRRAVAWVYQHATDFGGDPGRIFLSGHSSGAHLAAVILTTDWAGTFGLPPDIIKGGLCCSGMYDLAPVRLSARGNYIAFTDEMEAALSPQRQLDQLRTPLIVACGTEETPEFQRQAREFVSVARAAGKNVQLLIGDGYNHFEILETLANPFGLLGRAVLSQMGLMNRFQ